MSAPGAPCTTSLPVDVTRYWVLRQVLGADPTVSQSKGFEATYAALALTTPDEDLQLMFSKPHREWRMSEIQMSTFISVLRGEVGLPKSSWTVGRKNPAIQLRSISSLEAFLKDEAFAHAADENPRVNVLRLQQKVTGVGPWVQYSIMHHVLNLDYMVPRDSRVRRNALRCAPIRDAVGRRDKVEDIDDFLIRQFGQPCLSGSRCKRRKGNCCECLRMTPCLKQWYSLLNQKDVEVCALDALWHDTVQGARPAKRAKVD